MTKTISITLLLGAVLVACSKSDEKQMPMVPKTSAAMPKVATAEPAAIAPVTDVAPADAAAAAEVPKELAPVQNSIEAFSKANNRLPNNVEELVEKKFIQKLPPLPPGQIYYIDHATGRVKIGGGP